MFYVFSSLEKSCKSRIPDKLRVDVSELQGTRLCYAGKYEKHKYRYSAGLFCEYHTLLFEVGALNAVWVFLLLGLPLALNTGVTSSSSVTGQWDDWGGSRKLKLCSLFSSGSCVTQKRKSFHKSVFQQTGVCYITETGFPALSDKGVDYGP